MPLSKGSIIKSTTDLNGSYFESTTIVIAEYNIDGAIGFVINNPFSRKLNELEEFQNLPAFPLYEGGPVDQEHLFFIHSRPDLINDSTPLSKGLYFGGDFKQATSIIYTHCINLYEIKIFIGYSGWLTAQLEEEINEGSWIITDVDDVFAL